MQGLADLKLAVTAWGGTDGQDEMEFQGGVFGGAGIMPSLNFRRANGC